MSTIETTPDMFICVDCAMVAANGDWSGIDDPARIAEVEAGIQSYSVIAVGDVFGFSWSPCHACGTRLGGDRFEAFVIG